MEAIELSSAPTMRGIRRDAIRPMNRLKTHKVQDNFTG